MNVICRFCQNERESKDNLFFFCCNLSMSIWKKALQLCRLKRAVGSLSEELQWASQKLKGKALISIVLRIAWKATIYHIWRERNRRLYAQISESPSQLFQYVKEAVQLKTLGLVNIADDPINRSLFSNWDLSFFA